MFDPKNMKNKQKKKDETALGIGKKPLFTKKR